VKEIYHSKGKGCCPLCYLSLIRWDYTLAGLASICQDGIGSVRSGVAELEKQGYLTRRRIRGTNGQLGDIEYTISEKPVQTVYTSTDNSAVAVDNSQPLCDKPTLKKPICENSIQVNPMYGKYTQSITNKSSIKESRTESLNIHQSISADAYDGDGIDMIEADNDTGTLTSVRKDFYSIEAYRETLKENIEYDTLCDDYKQNKNEVDALLEIMLETIVSAKTTIRVGGENKPADVVKNRLLKLNQFHIEYVMETLSKNTTAIRNIKAYMLTALYNAPATMDNYYQAMVNHDLRNGK
jgi:hypothetical protein